MLNVDVVPLYPPDAGHAGDGVPARIGTANAATVHPKMDAVGDDGVAAVRVACRSLVRKQKPPAMRHKIPAACRYAARPEDSCTNRIPGQVELR